MSLEERDPEPLAGSLEDSPAERVVPSAFWASLEPSEAESTALADRILSAAQTSERKRTEWAGWRWLAAIAACVVVGFAAGWGLRSHHAQVAQQTPPNVPASSTFQVALTDDHGHVTAVQDFNSADQAREFAKDVRQWQERAIKVRTGTPVIVADRF